MGSGYTPPFPSSGVPNPLVLTDGADAVVNLQALDDESSLDLSGSGVGHIIGSAYGDSAYFAVYGQSDGSGGSGTGIQAIITDTNFQFSCGPAFPTGVSLVAFTSDDGNGFFQLRAQSIEPEFGLFIAACSDLGVRRLGFFDRATANNGGVPRQTVTGAKGGNAALTSLINALATYGLIVDTTT